MRGAAAGLIALLLLSGAAARAFAQADTTRRDTTRVADTTAARDTTKRDTTAALLPVFPLPIEAGPLPRGSRYTFTSDSLLFTNAKTLSDLLAHIPGVYVARGGWYGQAEIVIYGGRGPAALEVYWDGVPYLPIGRDSIYLDPARIPLAPLERIDVIVLPATLRVFLVSTRPRSTAPVTQIGISTGDQDIANYRAGYAVRTRSGIGASLLADWNAVATSSSFSTTTSFGSTDLWLKAEYIPPKRNYGASLQILSSSWHRNPATDGRVLGWRQDRRDRVFRAFYAQRDDGLGLRATALFASTSLTHDTLVTPRGMSDVSLEVTQTWPTMSISGIVRLGWSGMPTQVEARGGWTPIPPLTISGDLRHSSYAGGRSGLRAYATAGLQLPFGFWARGEAAWQRDLQSYAVTTDQRQRAVDIAGWVRFDRRWLMVEVGGGRRDPFVPLGFAAGISAVDSLSPTPLTEFAAAHATLRPVAGVELSGWYFNPRVGGADFEPPQHTRVSMTFYSKFWRVFRSGIFALRGEVAVESWSRWEFGGLKGGSPRVMGGATFAETNLEMQLVGVTLFWTIQNVNLMRASYVSGLGYPKSAQQYGARWFFTN